MHPPQYLALCGASSKGLMHLVLTLGICTTTATKLTCKKYRTGIHKFPKATYQPQDFLFSAALLATTTATIFKNILYASFAGWSKRLMDVCKGNFFLRRLPETGNSWASFVLFCFFLGYQCLHFLQGECLRIGIFAIFIFQSFPL